ncbi:MAG: Asp-tRNA(Asn)/Glu-tRNA(Gln) amidotransferase subunit GatA [Alphaproteobacteria bacterium]|nr:Asp-tRNA(Asn)/Glu-tRNA(Gln) amidotransferase subunit GatA [Candidatus Fonsibacter sp. PEL55]
MSDLTKLTLVESVNNVKEKKCSATELVDAYVKRIEKSDKLNCFNIKDIENAIKKAKKIDTNKKLDKSLVGAPIAVKDLFCTKGLKTTASSKILSNFIPTYESTVTENLVPGGSSGGCASAVAANLTIATVGTDTGGSIRQPAAFTGIVGLKPTYGRCSRWGIVAFASSLDQAGPMTKDVKDAALMLDVISGYDEKDSTSANKPKSSFLNSIKNNVKGLKVGIPKEYRVDNMPKEVDDLWQEGIKILKDNGAIIKDISLPHTKYALPTYYIIAPAEASSNLARYDGVRYGFRAEGKDLTEMYENTRSKGFGAEVKRRIMIGTYVLSSGYYDAYYLKAQKVRNLIKMDFDNVYKDVDVILTPTTPTAAFKFGENTDDPIAMYLNDIFTVTANLAGLPAISLPIKYNKDGLPLALQLFGKSFDEQTLLNTAYSIEQQVKFKSQVKDWWM